MHWPMHLALRCRARSKRSGLQCLAPAVRGMNCGCMGPLRGSQGNKNALKHGATTAEALALKGNYGPRPDGSRDDGRDRVGPSQSNKTLS